MKKIIMFIIIILVMLMMLVFTTSCKHVLMDFSWEKVEGSGFYSSQSNTSTVKLQGWLKVNQPSIARDVIYAHLSDWQFIVYSGSTPVLIFLKNSYNSVVGDVYINSSDSDNLWLWVYIETTTPKSGDIFAGLNPDTLKVSMVVEDDSNNTYQYESTVDFQFTRQ